MIFVLPIQRLFSETHVLSIQTPMQIFARRNVGVGFISHNL